MTMRADVGVAFAASWFFAIFLGLLSFLSIGMFMAYLQDDEIEVMVELIVCIPFLMSLVIVAVAINLPIARIVIGSSTNEGALRAAYFLMAIPSSS